MKKMPCREDLQGRNALLRRLTLFHRTKETYKSLLQSTGDDFMLLRFGRRFTRHSFADTHRLNKQFISLLHSFLQSILLLFTSLKTHEHDPISSLIPKINSLFSLGDEDDDDPSRIKLAGDLFSPHTNVDQWTWLLEQWRDALRTMPMFLTEAGAFSRLVRTTIGIGLIHLGKCAESMLNEHDSPVNVQTMNEQLFAALQTGFYFGIVYAMVDCAQDEIHQLDRMDVQHFLSLDDKQDHPLTCEQAVDKYLDLMERLLTGEQVDRTHIPTSPFTSMLVEAFDSLRVLTRANNVHEPCFHELALLLRAQRMDKKELSKSYDDAELYLGSILKGHFTYTCSTHLADLRSARVDEQALWLMPFLGQMTDDCRDYIEDTRSKSLTPFTHFAAFPVEQGQGQDKLNPFDLFLNLCSEIYLSSDRHKTTGAFLGRRIARTLRAIDVSSDADSFHRFLDTFCALNAPLHRYCWHKLRQHFPRVIDPEKTFFRAMDRASVRFARTNRKLETFVFENLTKIENELHISPLTDEQTMVREEQVLLAAMNYSVKAGGKRLRVLLMLMVGDLCGIGFQQILPAARAIEYLHTSSLIFDDLPGQDNSELRRGRPTLHKTKINDDVPDSLCEGRAQLAAIDLIAVSMNTINQGLADEKFTPECINRIVVEISFLMHSLCVGQMMDLCAARTRGRQEQMDIEQLDRIAWLKTGKTIEAVLITPVILSTPALKNDGEQLRRIRELSRLLGILFQMRDDLLDTESNENIGKPTALDLANHTVTYVSLLGTQGTRTRLAQFLRDTLQLIELCWPHDGETIKDVARHIVSRKH